MICHDTSPFGQKRNFVRSMAKSKIENAAKEAGEEEITVAFLDANKARLMGSSGLAVGACHQLPLAPPPPELPPELELEKPDEEPEDPLVAKLVSQIFVDDRVVPCRLVLLLSFSNSSRRFCSFLILK